MYGMVVVEQKESAGAELYDCFRVLDRDGNGYIERGELMHISKQSTASLCPSPHLLTCSPPPLPANLATCLTLLSYPSRPSTPLRSAQSRHQVIPRAR